MEKKVKGGEIKGLTLRMPRIRETKGFTLVELLVVMAIISILAVIAMANFQTSQIKARDAERKANMRQISNALEAYTSDHGFYPNAEDANGGKIKACADGGGVCKASSASTACEWSGTLSRELCDENNTVYMTEIPSDPTGKDDFADPDAQPHFCYWSDGVSYKIYTKLENDNDIDLKGPFTCNGIVTYNFGISSSNTKP